MPCLLTADNWKITGRWDENKEVLFINQIFKLKDRKDTEFLLSPTHEEEVTVLINSLVTSYKQLPLKVYQIGRKYRDEMRPRQGMLRAKEFVMKDMYSFDQNQEDAIRTYDQVTKAYRNIFDTLNIPLVIAEADTGSIGGTKSHEYHVVSEVGEDSVIRCKHCGYSANMEMAVGRSIYDAFNPPHFEKDTIPQVLDFLAGKELKLPDNLEMGVYKADSDYIIALFPSRSKVNPIRLKNYAKTSGNIQLVKDYTNVLNFQYKILIENSLYNQSDSYFDDSDDILSGNFLFVKEKDECLQCDAHSKLQTVRAIEVGHTFYLGSRYSKVLNSTYKSSSQNSIPFEMGCYGIGVSRLLAAIAEVSHDQAGLVWPSIIAPYKVCLVFWQHKQKEQGIEWQEEITRALHNLQPHLFADNDIVLDDRELSIGSKIKDALLVGYPIVLVFGKAYLDSGIMEVHFRNTRRIGMHQISEIMTILEDV